MHTKGNRISLRLGNTPVGQCERRMRREWAKGSAEAAPTKSRSRQPTQIPPRSTGGVSGETPALNRTSRQSIRQQVSRGAAWLFQLPHIHTCVHGVRARAHTRTHTCALIALHTSMQRANAHVYFWWRTFCWGFDVSRAGMVLTRCVRETQAHTHARTHTVALRLVLSTHTP